MTTRQDRYQFLNKLIDLALFKWHPDHYSGNDPETSQHITRVLLHAKRTARKVYSRLTDAERAAMDAEVRDDR